MNNDGVTFYKEQKIILETYGELEKTFLTIKWVKNRFHLFSSVKYLKNI